MIQEIRDPLIQSQLIKDPVPLYIVGKGGGAVWLSVPGAKVTGRVLPARKRWFTLCTGASLAVLQPLLGLAAQVRCGSLSVPGVFVAHKMDA